MCISQCNYRVEEEEEEELKTFLPWEELSTVRMPLKLLVGLGTEPTFSTGCWIQVFHKVQEPLAGAKW